MIWVRAEGCARDHGAELSAHAFTEFFGSNPVRNSQQKALNSPLVSIKGSLLTEKFNHIHLGFKSGNEVQITNQVKL